MQVGERVGSMLRKAWEFLRKNPAGVAILISSIFALTSLALSGFSIRDDRAGAELAVQVADLEVSLDQLQKQNSNLFVRRFPKPIQPSISIAVVSHCHA
jgi:hypothetical protein